ncbi:MAG TPA: ribbon-helix-helix domain-containing protein [Caldilineaceae bacterium]|nr:ribbon-helix-helix domain-containing protein [Caldilineaceae bacterium]
MIRETTMIRTNFNYTDSQLHRLKLLSEHTGLTTTELVRRAIDEYLNKEFAQLQVNYRIEIDLLTSSHLRKKLSDAEIEELATLSEERMRRGEFHSPSIEELAEKARAKVAA